MRRFAIYLVGCALWISTPSFAQTAGGDSTSAPAATSAPSDTTINVAAPSQPSTTVINQSAPSSSSETTVRESNTKVVDVQHPQDSNVMLLAGIGIVGFILVALVVANGRKGSA